MSFCRFCAHELHDSAPACPQCGGVQPSTANTPAVSSRPNGNLAGWPAIVSLILGGYCLLMVLVTSVSNSSFDADEQRGFYFFILLSIVFAAFSLFQQRPGKALAISALVSSALSLLLFVSLF